MIERNTYNSFGCVRTDQVMPTTGRITALQGELKRLFLMCNEMSVPRVVFIIQLINEKEGNCHDENKTGRIDSNTQIP